MKSFWKAFCQRGLMGAWGGPFILAIVWAILHANGVITGLTVHQAVCGILSMTVMAFIAGGVSLVYQIESLPTAFAALIHAAVLYVDYLGFYLLNGWLPMKRIPIFTLIFAVSFLAIWLCIYLVSRRKVKKINQLMEKGASDCRFPH